MSLRSIAMIFSALAFSAAAWADTPPSPSLPNPEPPKTSPADGPPADKPGDAAKSEEGKKKEDVWFAVINGRVRTVTGASYENATVLCKNGDVVEIGGAVKLPEKCETVDAKGMFVYPGLVAAGASGLFGSPPQDRSDVYSMNMLVALAGGITTVLAGNDVAKLTFGSVEDMVIREGVFVSLNYSSSRPLDRRQLWDDLTRVRDYLRDVRNWEIAKKRDEEAKEPDKEWLKGKYDGYRKLLEGQAVAVISANNTQELRDVAALARHFDMRVVVRGAVEGWTVAAEMGRAGLGAIITPRDDRDPDRNANRPTGSSIENARILTEHGVTVAIIPGLTGITYWGLAGRDLLHTNMEAAFAVRGGLSNDAALRAITIDAARILGVDDQVGSLEAGKDADMIVVDGDPLNFMTQVHYAVVNGRVVYDKSKDTLFAHIRPTGEVKAVEFDDYWPRRLEWPADIPVTNPPEPEPAAEPAKPEATPEASETPKPDDAPAENAAQPEATPAVEASSTP